MMPSLAEASWEPDGAIERSTASGRRRYRKEYQYRYKPDSRAIGQDHIAAENDGLPGKALQLVNRGVHPIEITALIVLKCQEPHTGYQPHCPKEQLAQAGQMKRRNGEAVASQPRRHKNILKPFGLVVIVHGK
jgi:hypothetical protein